jgi:choline dehydrogenase-like flavoprotein
VRGYVCVALLRTIFLTGRKFKPTETVDFVVVGSGAAGAVIARELAQAGFCVVVLEQGPRLTSADFEHDEFKYFYLSGISNDPTVSPQTFRDDPGQTAQRPHWGNSLIYARMVGGSSNHFTAIRPPAPRRFGRRRRAWRAAACTCSELAEWATTLPVRSSTNTIERTMCRIFFFATVRVSSPPDGVSRR